jgi:hypothetical protein
MAGFWLLRLQLGVALAIQCVRHVRSLENEGV